MNAALRAALRLARALAWTACGVLCAACGPHGKLESRASVFILLPEDLAITPSDVSFAPQGHVRAARLDRTNLLSLETDGQSFQVLVPGVCPTRVPAAPPEAGLKLTAVPLIDFGPRYLPQVGYDRVVEIRARAGCRKADGIEIEWAQVEGPALRDMQISDRGWTLRGRTLPLAHFFPNPLPKGVVAISPRTQGRYVLEATARLPFGAAITKRITITSLARSTGLSTVAVSQRLLFGDADLSLRVAPRGSRAQVEITAGAATFMADVAGRYVLAPVAGRPIELQALAHERTPLDCGRRECHASQAADARDTAMSRALERLADPHGAVPNAARCALECHVVGEAGLDDGGFVDVSRALRFADLEHTPLSALPAALRRLAGVRCTSCHGPGTIPPPATRARILRADVCATCHDAPPTYNHVNEWKQSRMARADQDVRTRVAPACARCHTTGGFLDALGVRGRHDLSRDPDDQAVGIACAACHAPHGAHRARALLRATAAAESLAPDAALHAMPSALCTQCHAPLDQEVEPSASSAALWLGRVRVPDALGGGVLEGPAPHAALEGGCMACHGSAPAAARASTRHDFAVEAQRCRACHMQDPSADQVRIRERARQLADELAASCAIAGPNGPGPEHANPGARACRGPPGLARARYAMSLVLEDAAAHVHNLPFTLQLLEDARRALLAAVE
jgi:hypothetical protein